MIIATISQNTISIAPSIVEGFSANGRFPASLHYNNAKQIGHEVGLRSRLDASQIEAIGSPYCVLEAKAVGV
jgi:hypothetical protein